MTMSSPMLAEQLAQTLRQAGVAGIYGVVGESHDPVVDAIRRTDGIEWVYVGEEEAEALAACEQPPQPTTNGMDACDELTVEQASRLAVTAVTAGVLGAHRRERGRSAGPERSGPRPGRDPPGQYSRTLTGPTRRPDPDMHDGASVWLRWRKRCCG
jgi:hypothetical protein